MTRTNAKRNLSLTTDQLAKVIGGSGSGVTAIMAAALWSSNNADADALDAANQQRDKIAEQKALREVQTFGG